MTDVNAANAADGGALPSPEGNGNDDSSKTEISEIEARARRMGWRPEAEYSGPKDAWLPADKFIDKVESEVPVLRERNRFLDSTVAKLESQLETTRTKIEEQGGLLKEFLERNRTAEQKGYERAHRDLREKMRLAASNADKDGYAELERQLDELERSKPAEAAAPATKPAAESPPANPQPAKPSPAVERWVAENKWFTADPVLNGVAVTIHGANLARGVSEADSLAGLRAEVQQRFPEKFENPARSAPPVVSPPGAPRTPKKTKTADDLPPTAKAEMERFIRLIPGFTAEQYLKDYKWD